MDALKKEAIYTIYDIYALPDGERAELTDLLYGTSKQDTSADFVFIE